MTIVFIVAKLAGELHISKKKKKWKNACHSFPELEVTSSYVFLSNCQNLNVFHSQWYKTETTSRSMERSVLRANTAIYTS